MQALWSSKGKSFKRRIAIGIPKVHWLGIEGDYNALVIDLLGPNLEDLFAFCERKFSLQTSLSATKRLVILNFIDSS